MVGDEFAFALFVVEEEDNAPDGQEEGLHQLCGAGDAGATV